MNLVIKLTTAPQGIQNPTLRLADLLEIYAQDLRDQAVGGLPVQAPGYRFFVKDDILEVLNELP